MTDLQAGHMAPDVTLTTADGAALPLSQMRGRALVLYFYPKDDTPGCTTEAQDFTRLKAAFEMAGADVIGVSRDSVEAHAKFVTKHALTVTLASDGDGAVSEAFGVWKEKSNYGRKYMGIERSTFLIDAEGRIAELWRKVRVADHADAVLAAAEALGHAESNPLVD